MRDDKTLYLLDGTYYIFRAFHGMRELRTSKGMPTNGLFAFTNMVLSFLREVRPTHFAVAFDPPGGTFRNEMYAAYKANRSEMPADLIPQMPYFRKFVEAMRIPVLEVPGYEADDVIGTLVKSKLREGFDVVVLTGDKDLSQLVDERTTLFDSMRAKRVDIAAVLERFAVMPDRVADVLGLAGDTSDNIPGVPGIGELTAGQLIKEFGDMETLLANIDKVSGVKRKENLRAFADQARLCRELATIFTQVPLSVTLEDIVMCAPDYAAVDAFARELELSRLSGMVRELFPQEAVAVVKSSAADQAYRAIYDREELVACLAEIKAAGRVAFDLETTSIEPLDAEIVGIALAWRPNEGVYIPVAHQDLLAPRQLDRDEVMALLRPMLTDAAIVKVGQHTKYEMAILARQGIEIAPIGCDTMLAAYLLDANRRRYNLDGLAHDLLGHETITYEQVAGVGAKQRRFDEVSIAEATPYAAEDADVTLRCADVLEERLDANGLRKLHDEVEVPLSRVLARMESTGIRLDVGLLKELSVEFTARAAVLETRIYEAAGGTFSIGSPKQLGVILFEKLSLPVVKKTKTGPSTDVDVLEALAPMHPLPALILEYRQLTKLISTYVDSLPLLVRADTGRVHTDYQQTVAATGRLSSSHPNLQNIPIRTHEGRRIREAFIPREGWVLFGGDYSQIELRLVAHMSGDPVMIEAFQRGEDIHARTASEVFGVELAAVTREQRSAAKAINFGVIYGMGAQRLAAELNIPRAKASDYIELYFSRIERVKPFFDALISQARDRGFAETLIGRRRPIPELQGDKGRDYAMGERLAVNTPVQGTAADLIKMAMIDIDARLRSAGLATTMLLQVHDELVFEAPPEELERAMALVKEGMEQVMTLSVPLVVDLASGPNWAKLKG